MELKFMQRDLHARRKDPAKQLISFGKNYIYIPLGKAKDIGLCDNEGNLKYEKIGFAEDEDYFYIIMNYPSFKVTKVVNANLPHFRVSSKEAIAKIGNIPLSITPKPYYDGQYFGAKLRKIK